MQMGMLSARSQGFEYLGGRCKLASDLEPVSLLQGDILVSERRKRMKREAEERERARVQQKQRAMVWGFLKRCGFEDMS